MSHAIQVIPTHRGVGLTSCIIGLFYIFHRMGGDVAYYNPVKQAESHADEIIRKNFNQSKVPIHISSAEADSLLSDKKIDILLEKIIITYESLKSGNDIVIIGGLLETKEQPYATEVNKLIAKAIGADIVLATDTMGSNIISQFEHKLEFAASSFGGTQSKRVLGAMVNRIDDEKGLPEREIRQSNIFTNRFKLIAGIPKNKSLIYPRTVDVIRFLDGKIINEGEANTRRISKYSMIARTIPNAINSFVSGSLIITPSDRNDVIMATTLSAIDGNKIAGLILTGDTKPTPEVMSLCMPHIKKSGLPVTSIDISSWSIAKRMDNFNIHMPSNDFFRCQKTMKHFANFIDIDWWKKYIDSKSFIRLSPSAFKYQITKMASSNIKKIVLPEGIEPRTIVAANSCVNRGIADCMLLADPETVYAVAKSQGIELNSKIIIINPELVIDNYVTRLVELRKRKGMNETLARAQLEDNVMLGTMMLELGEVDGLVSGAVNTTANTIRPPLQIIKTHPKSRLVSSVFFMCLPDQVLIYGDCAINPNPDAEQLSEIAIQSADSATSFGISPKVAMISYSTGSSGTGEDVDKVREATDIVRSKRPDIIIDGPLQYDAAAINSVAKKKAPDSPVAGRANVFIFPDLNTGNTTYKAVQRSANAISIGPMLQGMRMPVNDLSRGALIDDIIYTIAITAVQSIHLSKS